jgi:hypothetical protein
MRRRTRVRPIPKKKVYSDACLQRLSQYSLLLIMHCSKIAQQPLRHSAAIPESVASALCRKVGHVRMRCIVRHAGIKLAREHVPARGGYWREISAHTAASLWASSSAAARQERYYLMIEASTNTM